MILTEEQLNHYKRHIIIPEIGEEGQKKLLNSTVLVYCENIESLRPLAYYLAALGEGKIFCCLEEDSRGADSLFSEVMDLNNDTSIDYLSGINIKADYRILLGNINYIRRISDRLITEKFLPTIISVNSQWKGILKTFNNQDLFNDFISLLKDIKKFNSDNSAFLANALSSTLCVIEIAKLCLNMGNIDKDMLFFDLLNMKFTKTDDFNVFKKLNDEENDIAQKLSKAKVLIVGTGGLGSPAAYGMTIADVGTLGLMDLDKVEISNLNRQILHSFSRIGMSKAKSAEFLLKKINPNINIKTHITELTKDNAEKILSEYDLIIAAVDNIPTRYLINDTCFLLNKPYSEAGVLRLDGTATTIIPHEGHCYRCLYPNVDISSLTGDNGVLGPVPGAMGIIQASEAIKILTGTGVTLKNKILLFDSLEMDFNIINITKNPECPTCGGYS